MNIPYVGGVSKTVARESRRLLAELLEAGLEASKPTRCVPLALEELFSQAGEAPRVTLFSIGKAGTTMARVAADWLKRHDLPLQGGLVVSPEHAPLEGLITRRGGHPLPASDAIETAKLALSIAEGLGPADTALCLISGGGSAMLELPRAGVELEEVSAVARTLMERGANIAELNAIRSRLSAIKGGGLARSIAPAKILNLILSDVPGHGPEIVASGPTMAASSSVDARAILGQYGLLAELSEAARRALDSPFEAVPSSETVVAADNRTTRAAIVCAARARGLVLVDRGGFFGGEARALGASLASELRASAPARAFVWGGETTVVVRGEGQGGRNQEVVLGAISAGWRGGTLASIGTDGIDGQSDAAGAFVDDEVLRRIGAGSLDVDDALDRNDSATLCRQAGAQLVTGPTGTNVADILLFLPDEPSHAR